MTKLSFRGYVLSKSIVYDLSGGRMVKIDIVEERELPGPVIAGSDEIARLAREVMPLVQQLLKSMPFPGLGTTGGKLPIPRITLWLTEDEVEALGRLDVGDYVEVMIQEGKIEVRRSEPTERELEPGSIRE
ncbi:MAG: arcadin 1 [Crenarchaeota archaeon]|nr:arcadin 1 [Thermoproteota archaeon]